MKQITRCYAKKKKKTILYLISGILVIIVVGAVAYFRLTEKKTIENNQSVNPREQIQNLQTELNSLKSKINNLSDNTQKNRLENELNGIESQISNLLSQTNSSSHSTIKNLEQELKNIKKSIEKDNPNDDPDRNDNPDPNQNKLTKYIVTKINDNIYKYRFTVNNDNQNSRGFDDVSYSKFINLLRTPQHPQHKEFFAAFQGALKDANSKFPAYFWKCPPVSRKTFDKLFEFVVIRSDSLNNITQDCSTFQEHFGKSRDNQVVSFFSPSGNVLISPIPKGMADYKNISQFTKNSSEEQQQALWKEVVDSLMKELEKDIDAPYWLNTEGTGVYYLHVRIDKTNKFYSNYKEYEKFEP